jgi:glycosyltransferase involved in cell wall biosynthesis
MQNQDTPLVSIITCFLNVEKFLPEALESVLLQNYGNWELLLVDDGSTDGSTAIAREYSRKNPGKIFYFEHQEHQNKGASASRNVAIKLAKGEFVTFLDGDDVFLPEYLSGQIDLQRKNPEAGLICEATEYWYDWQNQKKENTIVPVGAAPNQTYYPPQLALKLYPLGPGASPCICGLLIKKSVIEEHGMFDEAFTGMYDDQVLMMKLFLNEPVHVSSACNNRYRQRPGSLVQSSHTFGRYQQVRKRFLKWLQQYLQAQQLNYPELEQLIEKNLAYKRPFWLLVKDFLWLIKKRIQGEKVLFH